MDMLAIKENEFATKAESSGTKEVTAAMVANVLENEFATKAEGKTRDGKMISVLACCAGSICGGLPPPRGARDELRVAACPTPRRTRRA